MKKIAKFFHPGRGPRALAVLLVAGCILFSTSSPAEVRTLRLSHITSPTSPWHKGALRFAERVSKRTNGEIRIRIYPGASLAGRSQKTELQMVRSGVIQMHLVSPILLALYLDPRFDVYDLPWLFPSHEAVWKVLDGKMGKMGAGWLREKGFAALAWGANGFRQLTNGKRPIRRPEDLSGIKFRVAGTKMYLRIFRLLGGNALTMNFGEVFSSLQQGVIDGQENPLSVITSSRLYEVQKHVTIWNYSFDPLILSMNGKLFDGLSPRLKRIFQTAAREALEYERRLIAEDDKRLPAFLEKKGMKVIRLDDAELAVFRKRVRPVYDEWAPKVGRDVMDLAESEVQRAVKELSKEGKRP